MRTESPNLSVSEVELTRLAQEGHIGAFAALFDLHKSSVYSLCLRAADTVADAEQLIQAIFLDVFRAVASSPGNVAFSELLYRAADSRIEMRDRKNHLSAPFLDHLVALAAEPIPAPRSAPRFAWMRERMRSARAILSNQHA